MISIILFLLFVLFLLAAIKEHSDEMTGLCIGCLAAIIIINLFALLDTDNSFYEHRAYSGYMKSENIQLFTEKTYQDEDGVIFEFNNQRNKVWAKGSDGIYKQANWKVVEQHFIPDENGIKPTWYRVDYRSNIGLIMVTRRSDWIFIQRWE